jgi:hypothetical protein
MQAQEYGPAKWGIALRMRDAAVDAEIDRAVDDGRILRTHVMRPTWHFVARSDIRWLLELTAERVHRVMAVYNRHLELDPATLKRGLRVIERTLRDQSFRTRTELAESLQRAGLAMTGPRLAHMAMHAELEAVVCSGPRRARHSTYALLDERAPDALRLSRDEALGMLSTRFLQSHGPATIRDFVWWSGLNTTDAKRGVEIISARKDTAGGRVYWSAGRAPRGTPRVRSVFLLPIYDEYLVAYRDREAVPHGPATIRWSANGPVRFQHAIVIDGQVAGTWRTTRTARAVLLQVCPLRSLTRIERRAVDEWIRRYERFVSQTVRTTVVTPRP